MRDQNPNNNLTVEAITNRIKEVIETSPDVKAASKALEDYHRKKSGMEKMLADNAARKILLIGEKKKLSESFGESSDDTKKLNEIFTELSTIDEAAAMLNKRLLPDGEIEREGKDLNHTLNYCIAQAMNPIKKEYQDIVDRQLNDLVQILSDFRAAVYSAWPRKLSNGAMVRSEPQDKAACRLMLTDVIDKLGNHTEDFQILMKATLTRGMAMSRQPETAASQNRVHR